MLVRSGCVVFWTALCSIGMHLVCFMPLSHCLLMLFDNAVAVVAHGVVNAFAIAVSVVDLVAIAVVIALGVVDLVAVANAMVDIVAIAVVIALGVFNVAIAIGVVYLVAIAVGVVDLVAIAVANGMVDTVAIGADDDDVGIAVVQFAMY